MRWLLAAALLYCSGVCQGKPVAVSVVKGYFVDVRWPMSSSVVSWTGGKRRPLKVASESSWRKGLAIDIVLPSLLANVCFTKSEPQQQEPWPKIRPATLAEIDEIRSDSDGKTVLPPAACFDGEKSVRSAALAAGRVSVIELEDDEDSSETAFTADGKIVILVDTALEVAQREYAHLLGESEESVPLEQTIVIRRSPDSPKPNMLGEIVATRKNADVYENFQLGYWNNRVESEAWSDKFKSAFDNVKTTGLPRSVEGEDLVYVDQPGYFDNVFAHLDEMFSATVSGNVGRSRSAHRKTDAAPEPISNSSLKIDIQGNAYEWQPTKTDRFLNPKETSDWEDGFSKKFDPSLEMYRLFALAPWKSDETGTELILDIEGACKSSKDDNSDLKAVALIINRLDKPNIDTSEAQNVYAIYDDLFFAVGDEVNPTVSRICKNRVIRQTGESHSGITVCRFVIDDFVESRTNSRSREGRSRSASSEGREKAASGSQRRRQPASKFRWASKLPQFNFNLFAKLKAETRHEGNNDFRRLSRSSSSSGRAETNMKVMNWRFVDAFLKSRRGGRGLQAKAGVMVIRGEKFLKPKGTDTDEENPLEDPRNGMTKNLLNKSYQPFRKHQFILQQSYGTDMRYGMKQMMKEFVLSKRACKEKKPVLVKEKSRPSFFPSYLFEVDTEECLDAIFEPHPSHYSKKEGALLFAKFWFIRLRKDFPYVPEENLDRASPIFFEFRRAFVRKSTLFSDYIVFNQPVPRSTDFFKVDSVL